MSFLDSALSKIFLPLLNFGPFWAIFILALAISLIITLVYKFATNQQEMKRLKEEQKLFQKRLKELRHNPEEMMKVQKEAMSKNLEYMKHSFKATLITMLPILIIFSWMSAHLMYEPIFPGDRFSLTAEFVEGATGPVELVGDDKVEILSEAEQPISSKVLWNIKAVAEGDSLITVKTTNDQQNKTVLITKELRYDEPLTVYDNSEIKQIQIGYNKLRPLGPDFTVPVFNWQPGWLGLYIILSIIFSLGLRKLLKIY